MERKSIFSHLCRTLLNPKNHGCRSCAIQNSPPCIEQGRLRVPPGVDFDISRQSHCPLINKEPVCVRPPKPYMAWNLTSMINYCRPWKKSIVTCSGFPAFRMLQLHKWHIITACGVLHAERSTISMKLSTCQKETNTPRMSLAEFWKRVWVIFL